MSTVTIQANQLPIHRVFSEDFVFTVPLYQRPYAWKIEQAGELFNDLVSALGDGDENIDEINPYFLGSIVLIKEDKPNAEIVDGQQRLTTLTLLIAALRMLAPKEIAEELTSYLYQKGKAVAGIPTVYRLTVRDRDAEFFREYVQTEGKIINLKELSNAKLSDSCKNIKDNLLFFVDQLQHLSQETILRLSQFIITRCFLVVVSTPDIDSAYRIFSVMNNRGMDLSHADILKAEIIGKIMTQQQENYSKKWEDTEEKLGRDIFKSLFSHIRMIYSKSKPRESILKEFFDKNFKAFPLQYPQQFIDKILLPLADAFYDIQYQVYEGSLWTDEINILFQWLQLIDNSDWIPPAIFYLSQNYNNPELLLRFFSDLDRLASCLMIQRANINDRIERYSKLLHVIDNREDLYTPDSPLQLTSKEKENILKILNGDLYLIKKIRSYVLLRLDSALAEGKPAYTFSNITVEHVLPQNPSADSEWLTLFPTQEDKEKYLHRLGNLVLLSSGKNSMAQNFDFETKKQKYFTTKKGICNFALTTQVLMEKEWTPEIIEKRQKVLIDKLKELWRL
ncbi:DUF262 domain-containing protein [Nostoc sp. FACHB-280]|uniref:DUF262 domain-containing protein n=1 Tax=Nostoc sp. FACHB-280 TaxID=2692839 RepID=UPI00168A93B7|nr:DUF262 domain-containing protein [Nostoc sp. FACHB-280]MBD2495104.1 DUF262 domain-containing protein [Nostoc sp. FACHB-280]